MNLLLFGDDIISAHFFFYRKSFPGVIRLSLKCIQQGHESSQSSHKESNRTNQYNTSVEELVILFAISSNSQKRI